MAPSETDSSKTCTSGTSKNLNLSKQGLSKVNHGYFIKDQQRIPWYTKYKFRWSIIMIALIFHVVAAYGLLTFPYMQKYKTFLWALFLEVFGIFGITAGAHRLWTHKTYKAKLPLQILLAIAFLITLQAPFSHWIRVHRVHHKFTDTDADPHDSTKGFFFSHIGWLLIKKPRDVTDKYEEIDITDIKQNPVISFFDRNIGLWSFIATAVTVLVPVYFWNEEWKYSLMSQLIRFVFTFHFAASVNSIAHMWGDKPFNRNIKPVDNKILSFFLLGEGWHNYHHVFPFDYRTPEFLGIRYFDFTGTMIEFFEKIGWAYDLRKPSDTFVKRIIKNKGDALLQTLVH